MWCERGGVGLILEVGKRLKRKDDHDRSRVAATVQKRALDAVAGANSVSNRMHLSSVAMMFGQEERQWFPRGQKSSRPAPKLEEPST